MRRSHGTWGIGANEIYPSGVITWRDGTRYRIEGGIVAWIEDRNGNRVSLEYSGQLPSPTSQSQRSYGVTRITDSLGRVTTIDYATVQSPCDNIHFQGASGTARLIQVCYTNLASVLATGISGSDYVSKTVQQLFPLAYLTDSSTYDPAEVSYIALPDGQQYHFSYNSHGEVARVLLPTGGKIDYVYGPGVTPDGVTKRPDGEIGTIVYRRVVERRMYPDGVTLEGKRVFSNTESSPGGTCNSLSSTGSTTVTVTHQQSDGSSMGGETHAFCGSAELSVSSFYASLDFPYTIWTEGKEYQTQTSSAGGAVLRTRSYMGERERSRGGGRSGAVGLRTPPTNQWRTTPGSITRMGN